MKKTQQNERYGSTVAPDEALYTYFHSTQELFSVKSIDRSGIFALNEDRYSKCFMISDVNFDGITEEEQGELVLNFGGILKSMSICRFSYTVASEVLNKKDFKKKTEFAMKNDGYDEIRKSCNTIISTKALSSGLTRSIYLTLTVEAKTIEEARKRFKDIESEINKAFHNVSISGMNGSKLSAMDINTRMQLWFNMTHLYLNENYKFDYDKEYSLGHDFINIVSPYKMEFYNKYFVMNDNVYGSVLAIDNYPKSLESSIMADLTDMDCVFYVTVASNPINKESLRNELIKKQSLVSMRVDREKRELRKNNDYLSEISHSTQALQDSLNNLATDLREKDEKYFNSSIYILILTDSKESLDSQMEKIQIAEKRHNFKINEVFSYQREAINSAYLFGIQEIKRCCNMSSTSLAMFEPFKAQDIDDENGLFYGVNMLSKKPIFINRKNYESYHKLSFGGTGSGKTAQNRQELILSRLMYPEDQQIIMDPLGEYGSIAKTFHGTIIKFEPGKDVYINPLDVDFSDVDYAGLLSIIREMTDFISSVLGTYLERRIDKIELSFIDKAVNKVYSANYARVKKQLNGQTGTNAKVETPEYLKSDKNYVHMPSDLSKEQQIREYSPIMQDVYEELKKMEDPVAQELVKAFDPFVNGSLNFFNNKTTVSLDNNVVVFMFDSALQGLRLTAETVCLEIIKKRIIDNFKRKDIWTQVYIDELHEFFPHEQVLNRIVTMWSEMRHFHGMLCGITQEIAEVVDNANEATRGALKKLFGNTKFIVLAAQQEASIKYIKEYLPDINEALFTYVRNANPGTGLIKIGSVCIPFDNVIEDKTSLLFNLIKTPERKELENK